MPANRRRRRAAQARARHVPARRMGPVSLPARAGLGLLGALLAGLGVLVLVTPRSFHVGRGFFFLIFIGAGLIYLAFRQPGV